MTQHFREVYLKPDWRHDVVDQEYNERIKRIGGIRAIYVEALKSDPSKRSVGGASADGHGAINLIVDLNKLRNVDFKGLWDRWMAIAEEQSQRTIQTDDHFPSLYMQVSA